MRTQAAAARRGGLHGAALGIWDELKTNRRALGGALAIVALVGVYGLLQFQDAIDAMRGTFRREVMQLQRASAIGAEKDWTKRAQESAKLRAELEARLWKFESEGLALANLQDWVTNAGRTAALDRLQVKIAVGRPKDLPDNLRQLTATISATPNEKSLVAFLERIAHDPHMMVVDKLHVQQQPYPLLEMTLVTYAALSSGGDTAK